MWEPVALAFTQSSLDFFLLLFYSCVMERKGEAKQIVDVKTYSFDP